MKQTKGKKISIPCPFNVAVPLPTPETIKKKPEKN
jgi:hypothetical protein